MQKFNAHKDKLGLYSRQSHTQESIPIFLHDVGLQQTDQLLQQD